jgi:predicted TIM-barrel fold metal-dependent hydrolase
MEYSVAQAKAMCANELLLRDYQPRPALVTPEHLVTRPRFAAVDAHSHLSSVSGGGCGDRPLSELIDTMDEAGVEAVVDLDGGWGEETLYRHLDHFKTRAPDRFFHFGGVDWSQWTKQGNTFGEWAARRLREQVRRGAEGLKIWKAFGLRVCDHEGRLAQVDDPRLDPIWETAGELGVPVLIHVADPVAFFDPLDRFNERWEELHTHPDWHFPSPPCPAFQIIAEALARLVLRHPQTCFIGAHMGCYAENLAWVGHLLDRAPNLFVDMAARVSELGRQPYCARRFFLKYADRILFGTDMGVDRAWYRIYYRFLETEDEYMNYDVDPVPGQGRWRIYGLFLPDNVLEKVYRLNALGLLRQQTG